MATALTTAVIALRAGAVAVVTAAGQTKDNDHRLFSSQSLAETIDVHRTVRIRMLTEDSCCTSAFRRAPDNWSSRVALAVECNRNSSVVDRSHWMFDTVDRCGWSCRHGLAAVGAVV